MDFMQATSTIRQAGSNKSFGKDNKKLLKTMEAEEVLEFDEISKSPYNLIRAAHFTLRFDDNDVFDKKELAKAFLKEAEKCLEPDDLTNLSSLASTVYSSMSLDDKEWGSSLLDQLCMNESSRSDIVLNVMTTLLDEGEEDKAKGVAAQLVGKSDNLFMAVAAANEVIDWLGDIELATKIMQKAVDDKLDGDDDDLDMLNEDVKNNLKV